MSWLPLEAVHDGARFGGKALQLGAALRAGLPVPPGCAIESAELDRLTADAPLLSALIARLGVPLAARSSAIGEDSAAKSFAGPHLSVLHLRSR